MATYEETRRSILEDVACGRLTPTQAAEQLAALDAESEGSDEDASASGLVRVRVVVAGAPVRVFGDPGVREAVAEGAYEVSREGDALVITAPDEDRVHARAFAYAGPGPASWSWSHRDRGGRSPRALTVRMNPRLALAAEVTAGSCVVRDVKGPLSLTVAAGSLKVTGFAAPIDIDVSAGGFTASGVLDRGESRLRCNAGSARVMLERGSSVRIRGSANAGRLILPDGGDPMTARRSHGMWAGRRMETVVGDGTGSLDIDVTTGTAVVRSDP
jgi:hypothetical protein